MTLQHMIDSASEISYKIHMTVGFIFGIFGSSALGKIEDFLVTFLLGTTSALGAGVVKYIIDKVKENRTKVNIRDLIRREMDSHKNEGKQ